MNKIVQKLNLNLHKRAPQKYRKNTGSFNKKRNYNRSFRRWVFDKKKGRLVLRRRSRRFSNPYFFYIKRQKRIIFKWRRRGRAKKIFSWLKRNKIVKTLKFVKGNKKRIATRSKTKYYFKRKLVFKNFLRMFYGKVKNKAFKVKLIKAIKNKKPSLSLLNSLENKLDIFLCRSKLAYTRASARYLINQKFISVNFKIHSHSNYVVKPKDIVTVQPIVILNYKILNRIFIKRAFKPHNFEISYSAGAATLIRGSTFRDLKRSFFINQSIFRTVLQYYR